MSTDKNIIPNLAADRYAELWADELRAQLRKAGKSASGRLIQSVRAESVVRATGVDIDIIAEDYLTYVDAGRRPGAKRVPIKALQQWIQIRGIQPRAGMTVKALPWVIQNSIWKKGIVATNVIPHTISAMSSNRLAIRQMEEAIATHIENQIDLEP